jgi:hypothetical protein
MASKELIEFEKLFGKLTRKQQEEFEERIIQQQKSSPGKRGGKVSRKRGKKIMVGYKAGGKV